MENKNYIKPMTEKINFSSENIITTSGTLPDGSGGGIVLPDDEW